MPDLDKDRIVEGWSPVRVGRRLIVLRETESTNDVVQRAALAGEPEGFVAFAETQTRGRGQYARRWESAAGLGLWFSCLLRPRWPLGRLPEMTPLVAVAVANAMKVHARSGIRIKPPNDIHCAGRKLAGILSEARTGNDVFVVVGIGININHAEQDFPAELRGTATSLAMETGAIQDRDRVAASVLQAIDSYYDPDVPPGLDVQKEYADLSR
mgnify:CR=1 FL=1